MDTQIFIEKAQLYLRGTEIPFEEIRKCAEILYEQRKFSYARRLLANLHRKQMLDDKMLQQWAISTCKDDDQPGETRFDEALDILFGRYGRDPQSIDVSRVAGNLGSIYKQKWRFDNQESGLKTALSYLNRGVKLWLEDLEKYADAIKDQHLENIPPDANFFDQGYCAINAAYVCDTLAARQLEIAQNDPILMAIATQLRQEASRIRNEIVSFCERTEPGFKAIWHTKNDHSNYWFYTTWAEALMGIDEASCKQANKLIDKAIQEKHFSTESWTGESAAIQISNWIEEDHFQGNKNYETEALKLLKKVSGAVPSGSRNQRIGIALSGGGFRASLFHIGVLARLAEEDLLRHIEVISCVSGGSIIGAYYYLKVRTLLQSKPDKEISKADYIQMVQEIQTDFMQDINWDLRSRLFGNLWSNIKMAFLPGYSRTSRIADLYDKRLYAKLLDKMAEAKVRAASKSADDPTLPETVDPNIYMTDLLIQPMGEDGKLEKVSPKKVNWKRRNKLPMLVLNATTLNTGHCWQFTATWMGEPPGYINNETDALPTLRRMYYEQAPPEHQKIRLSTAVAASSCVPGLFKPVQLRKLYQPETGKLIDVELVDGGVYDNQGINTLIDQECSSLIISDASGQLASVDDPGSGTLSVSGRTNAILQERIRACQLSDLRARYSSKVLKGYLLMHLTKGLPSEVVNWRLCDDPYEPNFREADTDGTAVLTNYSIRKSIQMALARIRTDLDAFHEKEAFSLMLSGFEMTDYELRLGEGSGSIQEGQRIMNDGFEQETNTAVMAKEPAPWDFERIRSVHTNPTQNEALQELLDAGAGALKVQKVAPYIRWFLIGTGCLAGLFVLVWGLNTYHLRGVFAAIGAGTLALISYVFLIKKWKLNPLTIFLGTVFGVAASALIFLFVKLINKQYLLAGRLKPLVRGSRK